MMKSFLFVAALSAMAFQVFAQQSSSSLSGKSSINSTANSVALQSNSLSGVSWGKGLPAFSYKFSEKPMTPYDGGGAKQVGSYNFPVSKNLAGVYMSLEAGTIRELHWHADSAEWAYMIEGSARITLTNPSGQVQIADLEEGGIWYFPQGWGHSIEGLGPNGAKFILVVNKGSFTEQSTFNLSDWISTTPLNILDQNFGNKHMVNLLPKKQVYMSRFNRNAGALASVSSLDPNAPPIPISHVFNLLGQRPVVNGGGESLRIVTNKEFPASTNMSAAIMKLEPGGLRSLHWHPNADEWQYILDGEMELTVFASAGKASISRLRKGDVGYVPLGYGHALKNPSKTKSTEVLIVFNSGEYQAVNLNQWLSTIPVNTLSNSLQLEPDQVRELLKKNNGVLIDSPPVR